MAHYPGKVWLAPSGRTLPGLFLAGIALLALGLALMLSAPSLGAGAQAAGRPLVQLAGVPPGSGAQAQRTVITSTLMLSPAESSPKCLVIDQAAGVAYLGAGTLPAWIIKVRLSDFARLAILQLNSDEGNLGPAALDLASGFGYFIASGTNSVMGTSKVVRVRLSDFTRVDALKLDNYEYGGSPILIDHAGGMMYVAAATWPDRVIKVRLSDFTRLGYVELKGQTDQFFMQVNNGALDIAHGMAYYAARNVFRMAAVRLSDFTVVQEKLLDQNVYAPGAAVFDTAAGYAYVAVRSLNGMDPSGDQIVKVRLSDLTEVGRINLQPGENYNVTGQLDAAAGIAYFATDIQNATQPAQVTRVNLSTFARIDSLALNANEMQALSSALDGSGKLYLGTQRDDTGGYPGNLVQLRLSDFTRTGGLQLRQAEKNVKVVLVDSAAGYAYLGIADQPGLVVKVRLSDFSRVGTLILGQNELPFSGVIDPAGGYAYLGTALMPASIVRVRLSDFSRVDALTLNPGEGRLTSAVIDPGRGYAYFGTTSEPGKVVRIHLSDFTRQDALALNGGDDDLNSAVIDPSAGYAYFGTNTTPGRVVRIHLDDFTYAGNLALASGENWLDAAVIDPAAGYAYFGTDTEPGKVVRVRLSDFTRVAALSGTSSDLRFQSAAINPVGGLAYFGTYSPIYPPHILSLDLGTFTWRGSFLYPSACYTFQAAALDSTTGQPYFGSHVSCLATLTSNVRSVYLPALRKN